jgi:hypothetical protein
MRCAEHEARVGEMINAYKMLSEDLGVDGNIKMSLREIAWKGVDWMHLVQDRDQWRALVNTVMNLRFS